MNEEEPKKSTGVRTCQSIPMYFEAIEFDRKTGSDCFKEKFRGVLAFAQDSSDYSACVYTLPEFGCVMWKKRDE